MSEAHNTIFPAGSPVDQLETESTPQLPTPEDAAQYSKLLRKLRPLLGAREDADRVYANGYFSRHYPELEKRIKRLLHKRVMAAWASSMEDSEDESKLKGLGNGGITIQINVGSS